MRCDLRVRLGALAALVGAIATIAAASALTPTQPALAGACRWRGVPFPDFGYQSYIADIVALATDDVWFAGDTLSTASAEQRVLLLHFDGRALRRVPAPHQPGTGEQLWSIAAGRSGEIWAVGEAAAYEDGDYRPMPVALRYDGSAWRRVAPPVAAGAPLVASLRDVAVFGRNQVIAAGSEKRGLKPERGLMLRFDGTTWSRLDRKDLPAISAMAVLSPSEAWLFGNVGEFTGLGRTHWREPTWTSMRTFLRSHGFDAYDAASSSPSNIWMVGAYDHEPWAERYDGRRWRRVKLPESHYRNNMPPHATPGFNGVLPWSSRNVWATAMHGIEHYDGSAWTRVSTRVGLNAIAGSSPRDMWAAGTRIAHYTCRAA